jgi:hypothetical protein
MMFQLTRDWPTRGGALTVPAGTFIDGNNPQWRGTPLPSQMPIDAKALDQDAYNALLRWYSGLSYRLIYGPDVQPVGPNGL